MNRSNPVEMEAPEYTRSPGQSMTTQESAEVVAEPIFCDIEPNEGFIQRYSPSLCKWRKISLAISICNQMRLVLEINKSVDERTAEKTGEEINIAVAEASQAPLPDALPTVGTCMPKFNCRCFQTPAGTLRVEMESVGAVDQAIFHQVANEVSALVNSRTSLSIGLAEELQDAELQTIIPGVAPGQIAECSGLEENFHCGLFDVFLEELFRLPVREHVVEPTHSANISAIQSGVIDHFPEQHDMSDSESSLKTMEHDSRWREHIVNETTKKILEIFDDIDQGSDRKKLETAETGTRECSVRLQKETLNFQEKFSGTFNDLKTNLAKVSKHLPGHLKQQLNKAIHQLNLFHVKDLRRLLNEAEGISTKLLKIVSDLRYRNLSMSKIFQYCASSVTELIESVLVMTSKFIPVADFNRYVNELYNLPNFRAGAKKVGTV